MRVRTFVSLFALVAVGCVVKEYDGPAPATGTGAPAAATPVTNNPTTGSTAPAPTTNVAAPTGTMAAGAPTPIGAKGTNPVTAPAGPMAMGNGPKIAGAGAVASMTKPNDFGQPTPFTGAIAGTVYAIPTTTTALPTMWNSLPVITTLWTQAWNVSPRDFKDGFPGVPGDRVEWFAIRWDGTFHVNTANKYHFKVNSDDGCKLYVDGAVVVNDDGVHPPKISEGDVVLTAGNHNLVIEYFQGPKWQLALQVWVSGPNVPERVLTTTF